MTKKEYRVYKEKTIEALDMSSEIFDMFKLYGEKLNKIYTDLCNGDITDKQAEELEKPIYRTLKSTCQLLGYYIYYQTDPRGATIYLDTKPISENNYTIAHCIY